MVNCYPLVNPGGFALSGPDCSTCASIMLAELAKQRNDKATAETPPPPDIIKELDELSQGPMVRPFQNWTMSPATTVSPA